MRGLYLGRGGVNEGESMTPEQRQAIADHIATDPRYKSGGQFLSAKQIKQVLLGRELIDNLEPLGTVAKPLDLRGGTMRKWCDG